MQLLEPPLAYSHGEQPVGMAGWLRDGVATRALHATVHVLCPSSSQMPSVQVIYMVAMVFILECSIAGDTHTLSLTCPAVHVQ